MPNSQFGGGRGEDRSATWYENHPGAAIDPASKPGYVWDVTANNHHGGWVKASDWDAAHPVGWTKQQLLGLAGFGGLVAAPALIGALGGGGAGAAGAGSAAAVPNLPVTAGLTGGLGTAATVPSLSVTSGLSGLGLGSLATVPELPLTTGFGSLPATSYGGVATAPAASAVVTPNAAAAAAKAAAAPAAASGGFHFGPRQAVTAGALGASLLGGRMTNSGSGGNNATIEALLPYLLPLLKQLAQAGLQNYQMQMDRYTQADPLRQSLLQNMNNLLPRNVQQPIQPLNVPKIGGF